MKMWVGGVVVMSCWLLATFLIAQALREQYHEKITFGQLWGGRIQGPR
jgi:hypothetical protein